MQRWPILVEWYLKIMVLVLELLVRNITAFMIMLLTLTMTMSFILPKEVYMIFPMNGIPMPSLPMVRSAQQVRLQPLWPQNANQPPSLQASLRQPQPRPCTPPHTSSVLCRLCLRMHQSRRLRMVVSSAAAAASTASSSADFRSQPQTLRGLSHHDLPAAVPIDQVRSACCLFGGRSFRKQGSLGSPVRLSGRKP